MGIAEGLLRIFPNWETHVAGHTISWNVLLPGQILALAPFLLVMAWPFLEAWVTGDKREHHLLQRPRDAPTRTAFMAAMIAAYGLLWAAGGNDILATRLHVSLNGITYVIRIAIFVVPPLVFLIARRWCIGLQRADNDRLGPRRGHRRDRALPRGRLRREAPPGARRPRSACSGSGRAMPSARRLPTYDADGVKDPHRVPGRLRARLSHLMYADEQPLPEDDHETKSLPRR